MLTFWGEKSRKTTNGTFAVHYCTFSLKHKIEDNHWGMSDFPDFGQ